MCTALSWNSNHHYFGRNLDLEYSYKECIAVTPRNYPFDFRRAGNLHCHYAMIGTATISNGYPLYYEATNEMGLSMAGLNFPGNAAYLPPAEGKDNISPFELIPWVLTRCRDVEQARKALCNARIVDIPFSADFPLSPLHWIISDSKYALTVEAMADGLHVYDNPAGLLTNNPPFDYHLHNLSNYMNLSSRQAVNRFAESMDISPFSNGLGAMGLPGDFSSASRFIKAAFVKHNSVGGSVEEDILQFFHMLRSVAMPRGCVIMPDGRYEITLYSSCCDAVSGIYYYTTYNSGRIYAVDMHKEDLDSSRVISYPMLQDASIQIQN